MFFRWLVLLSLTMTSVNASVFEAYTIFKSRGNNANSYLDVAENLFNDGYYFSAVPFVKEYLSTQKIISDQGRLDRLLELLIARIGVRQFEALDHRILRKVSSPTVKYIQAKKYFRTRDYTNALQAVYKKIPEDHPVRPFALFIEASIFTLKKKYAFAKIAYNLCVNKADAQLSKTKSRIRRKQLEMTRDYCTIGLARNEFSVRKYEKASSAYLDLDKRSYIWPEILFEEAWSSFYKKNFNRTLGKLVTYKAPVLERVFNPEVDVLRALTYLQLCLWADANNEVEQFYKLYQEDAKQLQQVTRQKNRDYKWYYSIAKNALQDRSLGNKLLDKILQDIVRSTAFLEMVSSFQSGKKEIRSIKKLKMGKFKTVLKNNLKRALLLQRNLIGSYVRTEVIKKLNKVQQAFEHMSYIKLEVLSYKKTALYVYDKKLADRQRGDFQYLKRNNKQYFWTFNGEFWADELGDYVFALKSVCTQ